MPAMVLPVRISVDTPYTAPASSPAYTLRYEEELSVREIAQILHCPEGTVKSRLYYTLKILQRSLSNYNPKNN